MVLGKGTSGQIVTFDSNGFPTPGSASGGSLSLGYATGIYYNMNYADITATAATSSVADNLKCVPFVVTETNAFDAFSFNVTTQSSTGTSVRLGIYNSVDGLPGTVLATLGTVLTDANGVATVSVSRALSAGYYWVAFHVEANVSVTGASGAIRGNLSPMGSAWSASTGTGLLYQSQAYGSGLPNLTGVTPNSFATAAPMIQMRST